MPPANTTPDSWPPLEGEYSWPEGTGTDAEATARLGAPITPDDLETIGERLEIHRTAGRIADVSLVLTADGRTLRFATCVADEVPGEPQAATARMLGEALVGAGIVARWSGLPAPASADSALVA